MNCRVCGSSMSRMIADLPFKVTEAIIVVLKDLPVIQCDGCGEYLIEDAVMERVDAILEQTNTGGALKIIRFAA